MQWLSNPVAGSSLTTIAKMESNVSMAVFMLLPTPVNVPTQALALTTQRIANKNSTILGIVQGEIRHWGRKSHALVKQGRRAGGNGCCLAN
jgi:hypothetical protein